MPLDLGSDDVCHGLVVEASAGTGKTYSVAAIVTRELALRDDLSIGQILITTYTRNAAAELRDRVRRRLVETAAALRSGAAPADDPVVARLGQFAPGDADTEVAPRLRRLERALVEFDSATISTIHGVCSRVLRMAGIEAGSISDADDTARIVAEAVNDLVVSHAGDRHRWEERKLAAVIEALRGDPFVQPWIDPALDGEARRRLEALVPLLTACVARIRGAMATAPSYNDLLRIACELVSDPARGDLAAALRARYRLAIVDEAQDTDRLQWDFFTRLFPGTDGRALVSVGDPKQAIYGFRGADVRAYLAHAGEATTNRSLDTNFRSDQPLLDGLNAAFASREFGRGILYHAVAAAKGREAACIRGMPGSVEFIDLGVAENQGTLAEPVLRTVIRLLDHARLAKPDNPQREGRPVEPQDICVLVRSGHVGQLVQQSLARAGIPAVTAGTSSVMHSAMASDIRSLLEAIERPADLGRVRRAAATVFCGHSLADVGSLTDDASRELEAVQNRLLALSGILAKQGIAALGAALEADEAVMTRMATGRHGERNVTDFLHAFEVLDAEGPGKGCSAEQALAVFGRLAAVDEKHDLVRRRVESDAAAVKIYTVHAAKGLEFPCVIVADLWKEQAGGRGGAKPNVFYDDDSARKLDLGFVLGEESTHARQLRQAADREEAARLLYVAATRAEHYLAVLVGRGRPTKNAAAKPSILEQTMTLPETMSPPPPAATLRRSLGVIVADPQALVVASPPTVNRTFRRMSFTGITAVGGHRQESPFDPEGGGYDEAVAEGLALPALPEATPLSQAVIELPAGKAVGRVIHEIFERVDTTRRPLADEVRRVVEERATAGRLRSCQDNLVGIVTETLLTPLGGPFGELTLGSIAPADRLSEMTFEMGLASLVDGVKARAIGELLQEMLPASDPLRHYAGVLAGRAFDVPVGGLLTGSIDAVVRLPGSEPGRPRLLIADYKSNKLHRPGMSDPLRAYHPERLVAAMEEHHYPLQALLYGTAIHRMLRWRLPGVDSDDCIAGVVYAFIRGMKGPATPADAAGHRYGVFLWQPPRGLWQRLSDLLVTRPAAGDRR